MKTTAPILLLILLLAGCVGSSDPVDPPSESNEEGEPAVALANIEAHAGVGGVT